MKKCLPESNGEVGAGVGTGCVSSYKDRDLIHKGGCQGQYKKIQNQAAFLVIEEEIS